MLAFLLITFCCIPSVAAQKSRRKSVPAANPSQSQALEWFQKADAFVGTAEEGSDAHLDAYRKAVELDPTLAAARLNLALLLARRNEFGPAQAQIEEILRRQPEDINALYLSGEFLLRLGDGEQAKGRFEKVIDKEPGHAGALAALGKIALDKQRPGEAAGYYQRSVQSKASAESWHNLGLARLEAGEPAKAIEALESARLLAPGDPDIAGLLGVAHLQQREFKEAADWLQKALAKKPDSLLYSHLGVALQNSQDFPGAASAYEKAVALRADSAPDWAQLGVVRLRLKRLDEARLALEKALALDPNNLVALATLGDLKLDRKEYETAVSLYERALQIKPDDFSTSVNLAMALGELGKTMEALGVYNKALQIEPHSGEVLRHMAVLYDRAGNVGAAIEHYRKSLQFAPYPASHFRLGVLLAKTGQVEPALEHLARAVALEPRFKLILRDELRNVHSDLDSIRYMQRFADIIKP